MRIRNRPPGSRTIALVVALAFVAVGVVASASAGAPLSGTASFTATFRVVGATHTSSSRENDPPIYTGSSTASWKLAPPSKRGANLLSVSSSPGFTTGLGSVNVRGVFTAEARSNRPGHCSLTAATGSKRYPAVAPAAFSLAIASDPKSSTRVLFVHGPGFNVHASLSNPYFPSECSTSISGEPSTDLLSVKSLPKSVLLKKTFVVHYSGSTNKLGIAYRWSTTFTLKRVALKTS